MKKINIGLIGFGKIGAGVIKALKTKKKFLKDKSGVDINIAKICDKDIKTKRPVKVPKKLLTKSLGQVLYDPNIHIVVELIGGLKPAKDVVLEALRQGKHVVTANKALLADSADEIFSLANRIGLTVGFEASVGGGIPIIRSIKEGFVANSFDLIYGIVNGTSNFILSKMGEGGLEFKEALAIAQGKGYAEKDPYLDISGMDSNHKLSVLAFLGFGIAAKPSDIYTEGITDLEREDIQYARELGYAVKLMAIAKRSGSLLELRVHPTLIPKSHLLADVKGVYNAIFVKGDLIGENLFYGEGAGARPTSSAVVSDIVGIARQISCCGKAAGPVNLRKDVLKIKDMNEVRTRFYIRFSAIDKPGVLARISGILGRHNISIATVTQKEEISSKIVPIVMMTHAALERDMARALKEIDGLKRIIKKKAVKVRVED
ncbi:MAG: homoserine dehydrogenase [Candidatus Omnitrophica bacterium]|nr:homoserine dehydrogenase [Candidatus Omnitrophota bacterium]